MSGDDGVDVSVHPEGVQWRSGQGLPTAVNKLFPYGPCFVHRFTVKLESKMILH